MTSRLIGATGVLIASVVVMLLVLAASAGYFIWHDRQDALRDAGRRTSQAARTVEEHTLLSLRAIENVLDHIAERILAGAERNELDGVARSLLQAGSIWYFDMKGDLVYTSFGRDVTGNYADRDYFKYSSQHDGPFVGPMIRGRQEAGTFFTLGKRVNAGGVPVGVVVAGVDIGYWSKFHESLGLHPESVIAVFRNDGRFIARHPFHERMFDANVSQTRFFVEAKPTENSGVFYDTTSTTDGITRIVAYRPIPEYGVFVIASESRTAALADWRWRAIWALALGSIAATLIVGLGVLARRLALLESAAQSALAGKASELQQALDNAKLLHRELQHRTKNNLQLVTSLLRLGAGAKDPGEAMRAAITRIGAIARAHADLHGEMQADRAHSQNVITETVRALTSGVPEDQVTVDLDVADCTVPVEKAAPLALIVNEVTTNALKYGVNGDGRRHITVSAAPRDSLLHIEIRDRGPGFPEGAAQRKTTGLRIIDGLAHQIDARYRFVNDGGAVFRLELDLDPPRTSNA